MSNYSLAGNCVSFFFFFFGGKSAPRTDSVFRRLHDELLTLGITDRDGRNRQVCDNLPSLDDWCVGEK